MRFILRRRLGFFVLTLWAALTLNFFLPRLMPGNPALAMVAKFHGRLTGQALVALEDLFGVNTHAEHVRAVPATTWETSPPGNFGISLDFYPEPVTRVVLDALPWTLGLVGVTTVLAFVLGTGSAIVAAWRRGSLARRDRAAGLRDHVGAAVLLGRADVILVFSDQAAAGCRRLRLRHRRSRPGSTAAFIGNVLQHAVLPALAHPDHADRRLDPDHAEQHDHHAGRGLRPDGPGEGPAQPADHVRTTRRATRSCPTFPASRCRSAS